MSAGFRPRPRNIDWKCWQAENGTWPNEQVTQAILMDIRDELQKLNRLLHCYNFVSLPQVLKRIDKRLARRYPLNGKRPR